MSLGYLHRHWRLDAPGPAGAVRARSQAIGKGAVESPVWQEWWLLAPGADLMTLRPLFDDCWTLPLAAEADPAADANPGAAPVEPTPDLAELERPLGAAGAQPAA